MEQFTWIHIADLRLSPYGNTRLHDALVHDVRRLRRLWDPPDCILISGNITSDANRRSFAAARGWLSELADAAGVPIQAVLCVPGDTDVPQGAPGGPLARLLWRTLEADTTSVEGFLADDDALPILRRGLSEWERFQSSLPGHPKTKPLAWTWRTGSSGLAVRVVGLNSVLLESRLGPYLDRRQRSAAAASPSGGHALRLLLLHSEPADSPGYEELLRSIEAMPHALLTTTTTSRAAAEPHGKGWRFRCGAGPEGTPFGYLWAGYGLRGFRWSLRGLDDAGEAYTLAELAAPSTEGHSAVTGTQASKPSARGSESTEPVSRPGDPYNPRFYIARPEAETYVQKTLEKYAGVPVLHGPPRSGVSWVLEHVAAVWQAHDPPCHFVARLRLDAACCASEKALFRALFVALSPWIRSVGASDSPIETGNHELSPGKLAELVDTARSDSRARRLLLVIDNYDQALRVDEQGELLPWSREFDLGVVSTHDREALFDEPQFQVVVGMPSDAFREIVTAPLGQKGRGSRLAFRVQESGCRITDLQRPQVIEMATAYGLTIDDVTANGLWHTTGGHAWLLAACFAWAGHSGLPSDTMQRLQAEDGPLALARRFARAQAKARPDLHPSVRALLTAAPPGLSLGNTQAAHDLEDLGLASRDPDDGSLRLRCEAFRAPLVAATDSGGRR